MKQNPKPKKSHSETSDVSDSPQRNSEKKVPLKSTKPSIGFRSWSRWLWGGL